MKTGKNHLLNGSLGLASTFLLVSIIIFFIFSNSVAPQFVDSAYEYYYPVKNRNFTSDASNITDKNLTTQLNEETQPAKKNIIIPLTDPIAILNATSFFSCVDSGAEVTPSATVCNVTQVYASDDVREPLTNKKLNPWAWRNTTHNKTIPPGATINEVKVCVEWLGTSTTRDDGTEKCGFSAGYNYTGSWVWQPAYPSMPSFGDCGAIPTTGASDVLNCSDMTSFFNTVEKINSAGVSVMHYEGTDAVANVRLYVDYVYLNVTYTPDQIPPVWSNQSQSTSIPGVGAKVNLSAYWTDNAAGLSHAWLATNETGSWENKTSIYLISFGGAASGWSNFTWQNSSIPAGTVVAWRIYANDSAGNENATDIMTFESTNIPVKPT